jgi:hypothetical protein
VAIVLAFILGVLALLFVLYPLLQRKPGREEAIPPLDLVEEKRTTPVEQEHAARVALQEVELDFQLGNIAETDYRSLRERYMQRALVALKSRYDQEEELDEMIEEQLRKMKEQGERNAPKE